MSTTSALRDALNAGIQSGEPRPFDSQAFLRRMHAVHISLKDLLLSNKARTDTLVPARGKARRRKFSALQ